MRRGFLLCAVVLAGGCQSRWDGILTSLSNPDPRQRAEAVRRMARGGSPDDLASLIFRVNDPAPEVRGAIAQMLGSLDNRQSSDALATLVTDDAEAVQLQAVAALARHRDPRAHHYLLLAYQQDGSRVRARIAELLKAQGGSPAEAVSAEAAALYASYSKELAGSDAERLLAAERLGSSGRPEAIERLTSYLGAESRSLATAAARGLGASGSPEALGPLEALLNEEDPALRLAGAEALGELADVRSAPALARAIERDDMVGRAALRVLARLARIERAQPSKPGTRAADLLCDLVMGPDVALSRQAARALREAGAGCPAERLRSRLLRGGDVGGVLAGMAVLWATDASSTHGSEEASARAALAPEHSRPDGEFDRGRLVSALAALLQKGSPQIRPLAADVIGALDLSTLEPDLERARKEAAVEVQRSREHWVKTALPVSNDAGSHPNPGVLAGNAPSLFSPEPQAALSLWAEATAAEIRMAADPLPQGVEGKGERALPQAPAMADELARDPAPALRLAATRSVPWLSGEQQWQALEPLLDDADPDVREAARADLARLKIKSGPAGGWLLAELEQATPEPDAEPLVEASSSFRGLPGLDEALVVALERPDTAPAAAAALAAIGDADARAAILSHLEQPFALGLPALLAAAAVQHWDGSDGATATEACRALLFHTRPEVRAAAVRALLSIVGPGAAGEVQALATDYDVRVRRAVGVAPAPSPESGPSRAR